MENQFSLILKTILLTLATTLASCTHSPVTNLNSISPSVGMESKTKSSGNYALLVNNDVMQGNAGAATPLCSAYTFPYDVREAYSEVVLKILENQFHHIELVKRDEQTNLENYDAVILVNTVDMGSWFRVISGFWSSDVMAFSSIIYEVTMLSEGTAYRSSAFRALNNHQGPLGYPCTRVPEAVAASIEKSSHESALAILEIVKEMIREAEITPRRSTETF